jgi:hypothetical protein
MEVQSLLGHGVVQRGEEGAPEKPTEHPDRQEEAVRTGDPGRAIVGQPACRDEAMNVRMMVQRLAPGMEDPEKADFGAEVFGITGNRLECHRDRLKQQGIYLPRML